MSIKIFNDRTIVLKKKTYRVPMKKDTNKFYLSDYSILLHIIRMTQQLIWLILPDRIPTKCLV